MPKLNWTVCDVCGQSFNGAPYVQVEVEHSTRVPGHRPWRVLVVLEAAEDEAVLYFSRAWTSGGWMLTRAACEPCVAQLPPAWRALFSRPMLGDWVPVRRLSSGEDDAKDTETWLVQRKPAGSPSGGGA